MSKEFEHSEAIIASVISPDGNYILTGGIHGTAHLWNIQTGKEERQFSTQGQIYSVAFSSDGRFALTTGAGAQEWDVKTGKEVQHFNTSSSDRPVTSGCFSSNGAFIITGGTSNPNFWDVSTGEEKRIFEWHASKLECVAFWLPVGVANASSS